MCPQVLRLEDLSDSAALSAVLEPERLESGSTYASPRSVEVVSVAAVDAMTPGGAGDRAGSVGLEWRVLDWHNSWLLLHTWQYLCY